MNDKIAVSKAALVALIGAALQRDSDELDLLGKPNRIPIPFPHPHWVELNPQPLPPRRGPQPEPWRSAFLAQSAIGQAASLLDHASIAAGDEELERALAAVRARLRIVIDDYCGTPPRWPWPWPWPGPLGWNRSEPEAFDLLVAGAQLHGASALKSNDKLQAVFTEAADRLVETGLQRLEEQVRSGAQRAA